MPIQLRHSLTLLIFLGLFIGGPFSFANDAEDDVNKLQEQRNNTLKLIDNLKSFQNSNASDQEKVDQIAKEMPIKQVLEHYQSMNEEEIKSQLKERMNGSKASVIFNKYPKSLDFVAAMLKDENALPELMKMKEDYEGLKHMAFAMIATFIISFIIKVMIDRSSTFLLKRFLYRILHLLFIWALRLGVMIFFFGSNLKPTYDIALRTFT